MFKTLCTSTIFQVACTRGAQTMKKIFLILFVCVFSFNTNAQDYLEASAEDTGYVEISDNSDSEKISNYAFEKYREGAKKITLQKTNLSAELAEGAVYNNKLYWLLGVIDNNQYIFYLANSDLDFSNLKLEEIKENELNKDIRYFITKKNK